MITRDVSIYLLVVVLARGLAIDIIDPACILLCSYELYE